MKISFRKEPEATGLHGVGHPHPDTTIKVDKKEVGTINGPTWRSEDSKWSISLRVLDPNDAEKKKWKYIRFKVRFDEEPQARVWVETNLERISQKYTLFPFIN